MVDMKFILDTTLSAAFESFEKHDNIRIENIYKKSVFDLLKRLGSMGNVEKKR